MTLRQFLVHIRVWLAGFPPTHTWIRKTDHKDPPFCLICGAIDKDYDPDEEGEEE